MIKITMLTPTFNRAYTLQRLYESLKKQVIQNFEWVIVDDGSKDNTKEIVMKFIEESNFRIIYMYKENGGKHTAINLGIEGISTELTMILDSDDFLVENATQIISEYWSKFDNDKTLCGLSFLKGYSIDKIIGDKFPNDILLSNHIKCRHNLEVQGDKAEVFLTKILREYKFPEIENEKFVPEDLVWTRIARKYNMVYINKIIYICEYLSDGISKLGKKNLINSSQALRILYNESVDLKFKIKLRIKHSIQYNIYSLFKNIKISDIINESNNKILTVITFPIGYLLYLVWRNKYGN